jgi:competence protein ComEA
MKPKSLLLLLLLFLTACEQHTLVVVTRVPHTPTPTTPPTPGPSPTPDNLHVYVTGAVNSPLQVHELPMGSSVQDAINAAGGLVPDAHTATLNLARDLQGNEHVHVPRVSEPNAVPSEPSPATGKLNVNTATTEELDTLPGVGPSTAGAIIAHREQHGPFQSIDELLNVRGIGPSKLDAIRDLIMTQ